MPAPGTLEWLAARRPDDPALIDGDDVVTRGEHDSRADALAQWLADTQGVGAGDRVVLACDGIDFFVATLAVAKLAALHVVVDPGASPLPDGVVLRDAAVPEEQPGPRARRQSGAEPVRESVTWLPDGRLLVRSFDDARLEAANALIVDLLGAIEPRPGAVHLAVLAPTHASAMLQANVALLGGGTVVFAGTRQPEALLELIAEHEVTSTVLDAETLDALLALPDDVREAADTTTLDAVVVAVTEPLADDVRAAARDLLAEDAVVEVLGSAEAGDVAVRRPQDAEPRPLAGAQSDGGLWTSPFTEGAVAL